MLFLVLEMQGVPVAVGFLWFSKCRRASPALRHDYRGLSGSRNADFGLASGSSQQLPSLSGSWNAGRATFSTQSSNLLVLGMQVGIFCVKGRVQVVTAMDSSVLGMQVVSPRPRQPPQVTAVDSLVLRMQGPHPTVVRSTRAVTTVDSLVLGMQVGRICLRPG